MKVNQIATMLNGVFAEEIGTSAPINEDLSNLISVGQIITSASTFGENFENYAGKIVDKIGKTIFVDRVYRAKDLGIWKDSFEYGSVLEKIRCDVGDFSKNCEWDLTKDGTSGGLDYNENLSTHIEELFKFIPAKTQAKYFNLKTTFKTVISITKKQLKSAFNSSSEMARFIGMIENRIASKMEISKDALQRRAVVNLIAEKIHNSKHIDLAALYTAETGKTAPATFQAALNDPDALRFIAKTMDHDRELMSVPSTIYGGGIFYTHTPVEDSRLIVISDLDEGLKFNLYSDTYNEEFVKLNNYKTIPFWQSSGTGMSLADRTTIDVKTVEGNTVKRNDIVGILMDKDAVMICNETPEVRSQYNADGNFTNYFYTYDCSYYNDYDENAVVYVWGDGEITTSGSGGESSGQANPPT